MESHPFDFAQGRLLRTERARMGHPRFYLAQVSALTKTQHRLTRNDGDGNEGGEHTDGAGAAEMFVEKDARQDDRHGWIERT
jgi:hypothetical protein